MIMWNGNNAKTFDLRGTSDQVIYDRAAKLFGL